MARPFFMKRLLLILALLAGSLAYGQTVGSFGNWCQAGNQFSVVSGLLSTNALQGSYPSCTVTVYLTGTLIPATIYASPALGALANPFTANADGSFTFWAATNALYDVVISGVGMPAPHTFAAVSMYTLELTGTGTVTSITATSPIVVTPSPLTTTGVISCPSCGAGGGNPILENCTPDQTGNSFPQVVSLTNWFNAHWEFIFNTTTYINCEVYISTAQTGATLVVDVFSADATAGHTASIQTCDAQITNGSLNVGSLSCAAAQTFTTTTTAYQRVTLTFNVQSTLSNGGVLAVKIGTSPTGTAPTSDLLIYPHFVL